MKSKFNQDIQLPTRKIILKVISEYGIPTKTINKSTDELMLGLEKTSIKLVHWPNCLILDLLVELNFKV